MEKLERLFLCRDRWIVTLVLCIGMTLHAGAQSFTQRIQKKDAGKGVITIHHSTEIDRLVNMTDQTPAPAKKTEHDKKPTPAPQEKTERESASHNTSSRKETTETTVTPEVETTKKVMRNSQKITGYRVQAFAGGNTRQDRQKAEQIKRAIKAQYPNVPVYVHFYSPRWICRVGNFRTYEEAHQMLLSLQRLGFQQASIVKGKITVQY